MISASAFRSSPLSSSLSASHPSDINSIKPVPVFKTPVQTNTIPQRIQEAVTVPVDHMELIPRNSFQNKTTTGEGRYPTFKDRSIEEDIMFSGMTSMKERRENFWSKRQERAGNRK